MTRGKQDEKSAARIARSKPGSREAHAAARAAEKHRAAAGGGQANGGQGEGGGWGCQNVNRSGGRCNDWEPCDAHRRAGT